MATCYENFVRKMFNKEAYSDATVFIHGMKLHAHRFVICVQSQYFENAFKDKFLEGDQGSIKFKDGSAMAHLRVFHYLYDGDYSETSLCKGFKDDPELLKNVRVYALADMFFINQLKVLSMTKFKNKLNRNWDKELFSACVREVYAVTSGSDPMRSAVTQAAAEHRKELLDEQAFLDLLSDEGEFVVDFFKRLRPYLK